MMSIKKWYITGIFFLLFCLVAFWQFRNILWASNINPDASDTDLFIPTGSGYEEVLELLKSKNILKHPGHFDMLAGFMKYKRDKVPPGKYVLRQGMGNLQIIRKLRSGDQDPVLVVINNNRLLHDLAGNAARFLETDSLGFLEYLTKNETLTEYGYTPENFLCMFIPNSYEMFWTTGPEKFVSRMNKENARFWNEDRKEKLKKHGLSPTEAYILASIVEKESNFEPERPDIAGVYLNRLKQGMKLQADPTVVFATGLFDLRRVLYSHLETDSPYNTYRYSGLPPGPICMPSISSLEAVINAEDHNYLFFCAKPDNSGQHAFAATLAEHNKNAAAFSRWLNENKIK